MLITHQDPGQAKGRPLARIYPRRIDEISIVTGCWLGARTIIMPGVSLGEMSIVAAGAVVTESFPSRSLVVGIPARLKKTIEV